MCSDGMIVNLFNGRDSFQLFDGVFDTCLFWYLLVLPSEIYAVANMTSMRPIDGNTSYHSCESFPLGPRLPQYWWTKNRE